MSAVPWIAGILGGAFGSLIGPAFLPLPPNLKSMSPDARRMAILKSGAVAATFGTLGAAIGVALTGDKNCCPCPPGVGTNITVNVTPPPQPPAAPPVVKLNLPTQPPMDVLSVR